MSVCLCVHLDEYKSSVFVWVDVKNRTDHFDSLAVVVQFILWGLTLTVGSRLLVVVMCEEPCSCLRVASSVVSGRIFMLSLLPLSHSSSLGGGAHTCQLD